MIVNFSEHDIAPSQPLNLQRSTRWIPPSQYYGDRFPRTIEEAFGPGARLTPPEPTRWEQVRGYVLVALVATLLCAVSVMVQS